MKPLTAAKAATAGRGWAYVGAMLGGLVSILANVAHSFVPPTGALAGWTPQPGAVASSVFWPVGLFVAVEILSRVAWPAGFWHGALRYGGLIPVAGVAALVSYRHLSGLLAFYGEDVVTVRVGPLAVDGLMIMATGALIVTGRRRLAVAAEAAATPATDATPDRLADLRARLEAPPEQTPEVTPNVAPAAASTPAWAATGTTTLPQFRRTAAEVRREFEAMKLADPTITQQQAAERLGIARRTLRDHLAATPAPSTDAA